MRSYILNFSAIIFLTIGNVACAGLSDAETESRFQRVTVCSVLGNPDKYYGREVVIRAYVESDFMHLTVLTDANCPKNALAIGIGDYPNPQHNSQYVAAMERARIEKGKVSATVYGRIRNSGDYDPHVDISVFIIDDVRYKAP